MSIQAQQGGQNANLVDRFSDVLFTGLERWADLELMEMSQRRELNTITIDPTRDNLARIDGQRNAGAPPNADATANDGTGMYYTPMQIAGGLAVLAAVLIIARSW